MSHADPGGNMTIDDSMALVSQGSKRRRPPKHWGKLISLNKRLHKSFEYVGSKDLILGRNNTLPTDFRISSKHCRVFREKTKEGKLVPMLQDLSKNGTKVNGVKVGRNGKRILSHGSTIILAEALEGKSQVGFTFNLPSREDLGPEDVYEKLEKLGSGGEGSVWICRHRESGSQFAMKIIPKSKLSSATDHLNELKTLSSLNHRNIIKLYDIFDLTHALFLIEELASGDLFDHIVGTGQMSEAKCARLLVQILGALEFMHTRTPIVIHTDLKPENILVNKATDEVKIADFGYAKMLSEGQRRVTAVRVRGSVPYMAPEVTRKSYGPECDFWSLGVIIYVMLGKTMPFGQVREGKSQEVIKRIQSGMFTFDNGRFTSTSEDAKDLIRGLLTVDIKERWGAVEVRNSKFLRKNLEDDEGMLRSRTGSFDEEVEKQRQERVRVRHSAEEGGRSAKSRKKQKK